MLQHNTNPSNENSLETQSNEKVKPQTTYRIYPQKIPALQKLLDRAYKSKVTVGTQCDDIN